VGVAASSWSVAGAICTSEARHGLARRLLGHLASTNSVIYRGFRYGRAAEQARIAGRALQRFGLLLLLLLLQSLSFAARWPPP